MAEDNSTFSNYIYTETEVKTESWIIPKELIRRLSLKPYANNPSHSSLLVLGEDGNNYDWCEVLMAHMNWVEAR